MQAFERLIVMTTSTASTNKNDFNLEELNQKYETAHPREILAWSAENVSTGLVQTSAFNVDDIVITDILYRELKQQTPVIFLDTLFHFPQTLELVEKVKQLYNVNLQVYKNQEVDSREAFTAKYGEALWDKDIIKFHDVTKIEPLQRGLDELDTVAWITGRRRDQAPTRANMAIFELDKKGRLKINPLATWTRKETWDFVEEYKVIYNPLHDQGYPSIGDEPITTRVAEGESERDGRWRGSGKTECGIHI